MAVPRAFACAAALLLSLACGGSTEPTATTPAGLWDFSFSGTIPGPTPGSSITCTTQWVADLVDQGPAYLFLTRVPFTVRSVCGGQALQTSLRGAVLVVHQEADQLTFTLSSFDTLLVATYRGSSMVGNLVDPNWQFMGSRFRASRRSGSDPNEGPGEIHVDAAWRDLEVGDSLLISGFVFSGYGGAVSDPEVAWSSSDASVATVEPRGNDSDLSLARVLGLKPGTVFAVGRVGDVVDSLQLTVLQPAASVEIVSAPDSLIVPYAANVTAVAKDASGQVLPNRRFVWTSSDASIAAVGEFGGVLAVSPGTATITARSGAVSGSTAVRVLPAVAQVEISPPSADLPIGETLQLTATTRDAGGAVLTGRPVTWSISNDYDGSFTADGNGLVRSFRAGSGHVVARVEQVSAVFDLRLVMDAPLERLAAGTAHTCGLAGSGHVYCWGQAIAGQLGLAAQGVPGLAVPLTTDQSFASIASRGLHTCALTPAGAAWCWGYNSFGQLGQPAGTPGTVEQVSGGLTFTRISAGGEFTCGLTAAGAAWCWGANAKGQLGRGSADLDVHAAPAAVTGGHVFSALVAGDQTACGLNGAGEAWCWGSNATGNLGLGTQDGDPHPDPVRAASPLTFTAMAVGSSRTCGISTGGPVYCWGEGQLDPTELDASTGWVEITAGQDRFCRRSDAGVLSCWDRFGPTFAPSDPVSAFATGAQHACARLATTGKVICWGDNGDVQLGGYGVFGEPVEVVGQP